eukprot:jgi/Mesen1/3671/ME000202S02762
MTNIAPLVLVLAASLIKEAFEDRKRHTQDKIINATITEVLRANEWVVIPWSAVRVGDIVRTSNLDGETNLKIRRALERTWDYPNNSLYTFTGNLVVGKQTISISPNQILLRVMMNTMDVPSKRSTLERRMDVVILILFGILFTLCFIGGVARFGFGDIFVKMSVDAQYDPSNGFVVASLTFFTLVTLFATVIPISLYVSIERLRCRAWALLHESQCIPKSTGDWNASRLLCKGVSVLVQTLAGPVEYIFSDKTGTLTRNQMEFFKCSIAGVTYGTGVTEIQRAAALRTGIPVVEEFFRLLAICHTVLPEGNENPDEIEYLAASPDEAAMVAAAKNFGFFFYRRTPTSIVVRESHVEKLGRVADVEYEILNVLEFNSTRKRQSVVCRFPDGRIVLYCKVAELIEKNLILLGCTAIEDKLQEGVPACIRSLKRAGIKIWVLTGDKMETAINIAYGVCNGQPWWLAQHLHMVLDAEGGDPVETARAIRESVFQQLRESLRDALVIDREGFPFALVIDGRCLMYALDPLMRATLLQLGMMSKAVVCCRVSPLQKAQVTTLMREGANKITLSIGDGANDVSMIQAAHVGVGVSGAEGMQAVMAADFAIAQFRFLTDLLLVHGRWSYIRLSKVVAYFFYKNLAFTLTLFWFNSYAGFSGQRYYDDWFQSLYNVFFTCLPVIVVGIFDKDIDAKRSKEFPELYRAGIENRYFSWSVLSTWLFFAVYHSVVMFAFPSSASIVPITSNGRVLGVWDVAPAAPAAVAKLSPFAASPIGHLCSPAENRGRRSRMPGMASLPQQASKKYTGFAFDTPGFESFFAQQEGVGAGGRAYDVARRASMRARRRTGPDDELPHFEKFPDQMPTPRHLRGLSPAGGAGGGGAAGGGPGYSEGGAFSSGNSSPTGSPMLRGGLVLLM